jgi:hypothetical protein
MTTSYYQNLRVKKNKGHSHQSLIIKEKEKYGYPNIKVERINSIKKRSASVPPVVA